MLSILLTFLLSCATTVAVRPVMQRVRWPSKADYGNSQPGLRYFGLLFYRINLVGGPNWPRSVYLQVARLPDSTHRRQTHEHRQKPIGRLDITLLYDDDVQSIDRSPVYLVSSNASFLPTGLYLIDVIGYGCARRQNKTKKQQSPLFSYFLILYLVPASFRYITCFWPFHLVIRPQ